MTVVMWIRVHLYKGRRTLSAETAPLEMCAQCRSTISATRPVLVVNDAYLYPPYSMHAEYFYARLHWNGWLSQSHI